MVNCCCEGMNSCLEIPNIEATYFYANQAFKTFKIEIRIQKPFLYRTGCLPLAFSLSMKPRLVKRLFPNFTLL